MFSLSFVSRCLNISSLISSVIHQLSSNIQFTLYVFVFLQWFSCLVIDFKPNSMQLDKILDMSSNFLKLTEVAFFLLAVLFHGDDLDPCLLYNVTNLHRQFIRHSIYQIQALKSISHFHGIIIRDLIKVIPEWSSGFPYFLQFKG